jgi:UDP-N-acetyl-D-mannosaminuronate dehydrogenase
MQPRAAVPASALSTLPRMKVGMIGLGYVGLPLSAAFVERGHEVVGLDGDCHKLDALARGESCVEAANLVRL